MGSKSVFIRVLAGISCLFSDHSITAPGSHPAKPPPQAHPAPRRHSLPGACRLIYLKKFFLVGTAGKIEIFKINQRQLFLIWCGEKTINPTITFLEHKKLICKPLLHRVQLRFTTKEQRKVPATPKIKPAVNPVHTRSGSRKHLHNEMQTEGSSSCLLGD